MFFAAEYKTSPFDILSKDIDDFIVVVNYLLKMGERGGNQNKDSRNDAKILVNDKTATGGWW